MLKRTKPLRRRALSKKAYKKTEEETLRTDEEAIQSTKMNSTAKKRRAWVEKGHQKSPRKKRSKRKEPYGVPTTIKRPRRGAEKEPYRKHQNEKQPFEALKLNRTRKRNRTRQRNSLMDEGLNRLKLTQKISKEPD